MLQRSPEWFAIRVGKVTASPPSGPPPSRGPRRDCCEYQRWSVHHSIRRPSLWGKGAMIMKKMLATGTAHAQPFYGDPYDGARAA